MEIERNKEEPTDLFEHHRILVDPGQEPLRIDKFLMTRLPKATRSRIQNGIKAGAVLVNDKEIKANYKVRPSDVIKVVLPTEPNGPSEVMPEDIPIVVVYEDDHVLIINKASGIVVHPGISNHSGTLVNALAYYFNEKKLPVMPSNSRDRPGLVHRLDKDTSGLMVVAKTEIAMTHLAKQFFDHSIERSYQALVWGDFKESSGTVTGHVGRDITDRTKMNVYPDGDVGKHAVTHYEVICDYYYVSLVKCNLETGRTHQIRAHMRHLGHPVFNDAKYGGNHIRKGTVYSKYKQFVENCFQLCQRQALHAKTLGFVHPATNEFVRFESELPPDMAAALAKWEGYFETKGKS